MGNATCCSGFFLLWFTVAISLCCTLSPFWLMVDALGSQSAIGLFVGCNEPYDSARRNCYFIDFSLQPDWFIACAVLWAIGTGIVVLCALFSCGVCCCRRCCSYPVSGFAVLAGLLFVVTIIVYGVNMENLFDRSKVVYYDWTFYISWLVVILAFCVSSLFGKTGYDKNGAEINPI